MAKNKEFPPTPKDESQKAFLQSHGVVFLEDEWEAKIVEMFFSALEIKEYFMGLNFEYCKCYCEKFNLDIVEIWSILNKLLGVINKGLK
ncbi:hypothetical protein [Campylobacter ureolyticus]|uniref:hypothetical protein n=1 Tax=Campylobacter ureolyticus TaxID=827 RepID=UPI001FC8DB5B|nr:hypothetical protein [Campylobacter ureolyticus]